MNSYNSINEMQNDKINSALIKIEALQKEYEVTLQQYQEAGKNYINSLQNASSNPNNSTNSKFVALKGRTWWGSSGLSEASVSTQEECETMCANDSKCSGATFNPVKRYCWIRTGESNITPGLADDYALITQQKAALSVMRYLNQRLLDLNEQITNELRNINPEFEQQNQDKNEKQQQLYSSYEQLLEQKIEMDKQLKEYYSINQEEQEQELFVIQQNISYRFWMLITCLVLLITITKFFGVDNPSISMTVLLLIIIVLIPNIICTI